MTTRHTDGLYGNIGPASNPASNPASSFQLPPPPPRQYIPYGGSVGDGVQPLPPLPPFIISQANSQRVIQMPPIAIFQQSTQPTNNVQQIYNNITSANEQTIPKNSPAPLNAQGSSNASSSEHYIDLSQSNSYSEASLYTDLSSRNNSAPLPPVDMYTTFPARSHSPYDSVDSSTGTPQLHSTSPSPSANAIVTTPPRPLSFIEKLPEVIREILNNTNELDEIFPELHKINKLLPQSIDKFYQNNRYYDIVPYTHNLAQSPNVRYLDSDGNPKPPFGISCITTCHPNHPVILATESPKINGSITDSNSSIHANAPMNGSSALAPFAHFWWNMIDMGIDHIFMLTQLTEGRSIKAERYWPEQGEVFCAYNHDASLFFNITLKSTSSDYFENKSFEISIYKNSDNEGDPCLGSFQIHHHQYLRWPDRGAINDLDKMTSAASQYKGKIAVQCSAGVGRTGTFIAALQLPYFLKECIRKDGLDPSQTPFTSSASTTHPQTKKLSPEDKKLAGHIIELIAQIRIQRSHAMVQSAVQFESLFNYAKELLRNSFLTPPQPTSLPQSRYKSAIN